MTNCLGELPLVGWDCRPWKVSLFGELTVYNEGDNVNRFGSRQAACLLAMLALQADPVPRSKLIAELWPGESKEAALPRLRQELFRLKRSLGPAAEILEVRTDSVHLARELVSSDFETVLELDEISKSCDEVSRERVLRRIAELSSRELLGGFEGQWVVLARRAVLDQIRSALLTLASMLQHRQADEAVAYARRAARLEEFYEPAQLALVDILVETGNASGALAELRAFETRLRDERQLPPTASMHDRWKKILHKSRLAREQETPVDDIEWKPLPKPIRAILGREKEIEELSKALAPSAVERLITLVAFGGMGKTRLAVEVAAKLYDDYERRVGFVSLVEIDSPAILMQRIAETIASRDKGLQDLETAISAHLGKKPALLVLDNFEDLAPEGLQVVRGLLENNSGLKILITSRSALGMLEEQTYTLPPLPLPDEKQSAEDALNTSSIALFLDQTRKVSPDFQVDSKSLTNIVKLVDRLEGIPLAILLAACRMRTVSTQEALDGLTDRLSFLSAASGTFESRHNTMRATIDWSGEGLPEEVRSFWFKLAVFHGGWSLEGAKVVLEEPRALDLLEHLMACSLVRRKSGPGPARFEMFEPLRQYAREKLQEADRRVLAARHAQYIHDLAAQADVLLRKGEYAESFRSIEADADNIRAALDWSLENDPLLAVRICSEMRLYWIISGHQTEGRSWMEKVLNPECERLDPRAHYFCTFGSGVMSTDQGDYDNAVKRFEACRASADRVRFPLGKEWSNLNLANIHMIRGELAQARDKQEEALTIFRKLGVKEGIAHSLSDMGKCLVGLGQKELGRTMAEQSLAIRYDVAWINGTAYSEARLGSVLVQLGEYERAAHHLKKSLEFCESVREVTVQIDAMTDLIYCQIKLENYQEAEGELAEFRKLSGLIGNKSGLAAAYLFDARLSLARNELFNAVDQARHGLWATLEIDAPISQLDALACVARMFVAVDHLEPALTIAWGIDRVYSRGRLVAWPSSRLDFEEVIQETSQRISPARLGPCKQKAEGASIETLVSIARTA